MPIFNLETVPQKPFEHRAFTASLFFQKENISAIRSFSLRGEYFPNFKLMSAVRYCESIKALLSEARYEEVTELLKTWAKETTPNNADCKAAALALRCRVVLINLLCEKKWDSAARLIEHCRSLADAHTLWSVEDTEADVTEYYNLSVYTPSAFPLHCACFVGAPAEVVRLIAEAIDTKEVTDTDTESCPTTVDTFTHSEDGRTALHIAIAHHSWDAVRVLLLEFNADPTCNDWNNLTALHMIAQANNPPLDIVDKLFADVLMKTPQQQHQQQTVGPPCPQQSNSESTVPPPVCVNDLLHLSIDASSWKVARRLITAYKADITVIGMRGNTFLHLLLVSNPLFPASSPAPPLSSSSSAAASASTTPDSSPEDGLDLLRFLLAHPKSSQHILKMFSEHNEDGLTPFGLVVRLHVYSMTIDCRLVKLLVALVVEFGFDVNAVEAAANFDAAEAASPRRGLFGPGGRRMDSLPPRSSLVNSHVNVLMNKRDEGVHESVKASPATEQRRFAYNALVRLLIERGGAAVESGADCDDTYCRCT